MESLSDFPGPVATQFNPCEQLRDGPFEETSGGGRTKRVRAPAPNQRRREELASFRGSPLGWARNLEMISARFRVRA